MLPAVFHRKRRDGGPLREQRTTSFAFQPGGGAVSEGRTCDVGSSERHQFFQGRYIPGPDPLIDLLFFRPLQDCIPEGGERHDDGGDGDTVNGEGVDRAPDDP